MAPAAGALQGAIAATRFGLGARPGEIGAASADPQGWLAFPDSATVNPVEGLV